MPPIFCKPSRRAFLLASVGAAITPARESGAVEHIKAPPGALQPEAAVDAEGVIHLVYLYGDPAAADIGYIRKAPHERAFRAPVRVNSQPGSAIAIGTVRGAQVALGSSGRVPRRMGWFIKSRAQRAARRLTHALYPVGRQPQRIRTAAQRHANRQWSRWRWHRSG